MLTEPSAEEVDKHLEVMRKIVKTTLFGRWFGRGRETPVCGEPMSKIIKKLQSATSLADLNDVDAKALTVKFFDETHKSNKKSNLYNDLKTRTNQVNGKCVRFGRALDMIYCFTAARSKEQAYSAMTNGSKPRCSTTSALNLKPQ